MVSTVNSYRPPVTTACKPRISPGSAIRIIKVLPSREVVESLARPWQRIKIPQGRCPSTRTTACSGKTAACFILLNASIESWERLQKKLRERKWHLRQLSMQFKPDTLIGAPPSSAKTRLRRFWRETIDQQQIFKSRISSNRPFAEDEDDDRRFARWLPFHFGRETQCLQHSACPQRPRLAAGLATLPSVGRTGSGEQIKNPYAGT